MIEKTNLLVHLPPSFNTYEQTTIDQTVSVEAYSKSISNPHLRKLFDEIVNDIRAGKKTADYTQTTSGRTIYVDANRGAIVLKIKLSWT